MKLKWNWGTKIALLYSSFVLFMLFMVYMSFGQKYDLVTENYYAKELVFQRKIDSQERYEQLDIPLKVEIADNYLNIIFPHSKEVEIKGKVDCFRPSDENQDFEFPFNSNGNIQSIPLEKFSKGKYLLKLDWVVLDTEYYTERTIIIP